MSEQRPERVGLVITNGYVMTMDSDNTVLDTGAVAVDGDRIRAVGSVDDIARRFEGARTIDASGQVIMPGLVDTYSHAGHGMIKAIFRAGQGWPSNPIYWHSSTPDWWYAEAMLSALERIRFGTTTGATILGATPARADSPVYADRHLDAIEQVGTRTVLGVGPPDPFVHHLPRPWSGSHYENGEWVERPFTYEDTIANTVDVIKRRHGGADGRHRIAIAMPYLFGRQVQHFRNPYVYDPEKDAPVMLRNAQEARQIANDFGVQIHTHVFPTDLTWTVKHFGRDNVLELLGPDVVLDHANGLSAPEIELIARRGAHIAAVTFVGETVSYGPCPVIDLLDAGVNVAFATDGSAPYFSLDVWKELSRGMFTHRIVHQDMSLLPPGKALRMVTIDAAKVLNMEDEIGSLESGKKADIILVDLDRPHLTPATFVPSLLAYYANGNDVHTTIVDGKILMEDRVVKSVDESAMLELVREENARALGRHDVSEYVALDDSFWNSVRDRPES
jgi:5-methylthioadenosine/S-adenosylhomocysteine deaminase